MQRDVGHSLATRFKNRSIQNKDDRCPLVYFRNVFAVSFDTTCQCDTLLQEQSVDRVQIDLSHLRYHTVNHENDRLSRSQKKNTGKKFFFLFYIYLNQLK